MQINLSELFISDGKEKTYEVPLEMDTFTCGAEVYPVKEKSPVVLHVRHEKDRQLTITGHTALQLEIPCDRCLSPVLYPFEIEIEKQLLVNLPMKVLCSEDCKGICNRCGANLNIEQCQCEDSELDPRMASIRDIFNKFKEV